MAMIFAAFLVQAVVSVPAPARSTPVPVVDTFKLSLVVADTVSETDLQPLCAQRDRCNALYLARYRDAITLAGPPVPPSFVARAEMGSPWNMSYRLAVILEHRDGREPLVRSMAGFGDRSHEACFPRRDTDPLGWEPAGTRIIVRKREICVVE